jgi:hypothetical protein
LRNALQGLAKAYPTATVIPFSAKTRAGRDEVWKRIRQSVEGFRQTAFQS